MSRAIECLVRQRDSAASWVEHCETEIASLEAQVMDHHAKAREFRADIDELEVAIARLSEKVEA